MMMFDGVVGGDSLTKKTREIANLIGQHLLITENEDDHVIHARTGTAPFPRILNSYDLLCTASIDVTANR